MNVYLTTCVAIVVAATVSIFVLLPSSVTLSVGDPGSRVYQISQYGYGKSIFNLRRMEDTDGVRLEPSAFAIGPDGYHLLIWHNDRIDSMRYFRYEQPVPNTYRDWHDSKLVETFTVPRPSTIPYFVGMVILGIAGFTLARFRRISIALFIVLLIFVALMVFATSVLANTIAIMPALFATGWVFAALAGRSMSELWATIDPMSQLAG